MFSLTRQALEALPLTPRTLLPGDLSPRALLPKLPLLVATPLTKLPFGLQQAALLSVLRKVFAQPLADGDCDFLINRWLRVEFMDLNHTWLFSASPTREILMRKDGIADASIRGNIKSFLQLAARREDPDTLFFQRELIIEGDTELGLQVKNLLDRLEPEQMSLELLFLVRTGAEYTGLFC